MKGRQHGKEEILEPMKMESVGINTELLQLHQKVILIRMK
jgi:hypothetical protein